MSKNEFFYQSGATYSVTSNGITSEIHVDTAFDYLRIFVEPQKCFKDSKDVKEHLRKIISCIEELETKSSLYDMPPIQTEK